MSQGSRALPDISAIEKKWQERWREQRENPPPAISQATPAVAAPAVAAPAVAASPESSAAGVESHAPRPAEKHKRYYVLDMFPYPSLRGFSVNQLRGICTSDVMARYQEALGRSVFRPIGWDSFGLAIETEAAQLGVTPAELVQSGIEVMRGQLHAFGARVNWETEFCTSDPEYYRWTQWLFLRLLERGLAVREEVSMRVCSHCRINLANEETAEGNCIHCGNAAGERKIQEWTLRITDYADRLHKGLRNLQWPQRVISMQKHWIGRRTGYKLTLNAMSEFQHEYAEIDVFVRHVERICGSTYLLLAPEHPVVDSICDELYKDEVEAYRQQVCRLTERERLASKGTPDGRPTGAYAINPTTLREMPIWISAAVLPTVAFGAVLGVPAHSEWHRVFAQRHRLAVRTAYQLKSEYGRGGVKVRAREGTSEVAVEDPRVMAGGGPYAGMPVAEAREKIQQLLLERSALRPHVTYNLRDWIFARQRYWGEPIPVIYCEKCGVVPVPEQDLPVKLPPVTQIPPADQSRPTLEHLEEFYKTTCPRCGQPARRETDTMPQWAASCWYYLRYLDAKSTDAPFRAEQVKDGLPVDLCVGGIEHAILHLLYVRFFSYFVKDLGLTDQEEPFLKLFNQGRLYRRAPSEERRRVPTHRGDRIDAGAYLERFGADAFRLHLLFLGPPSADVVWSEQGLDGCRRFLRRTLQIVYLRAEKGRFVSRRVLVEKHRLIRRVTQAIESFRLNNAVSAFMQFSKFLRTADLTLEEVDRSTLRTFAILLAPFCPHVASELWERLGGGGSVFEQRWPEFSPELLKPVEVEIVIYVNDRARDRLLVESGVSKNALIELASARERIRREIGDRIPVRTIHVPDRILKFVLPPPASPAAS